MGSVSSRAKTLYARLPRSFKDNLIREWLDPPVIEEKRLTIFERYPVLRGMLTYALVYPCSSLMQQYAAGAETFDWAECVHFALFGSLWVAPSMYFYHRFADWLYPDDSVLTMVKKALLEQVLYSPFSVISFYYGMGFIQGQSQDEIKLEVHEKFWPTYKVGWIYWPVIAIIDFIANRRKDSLPIIGQLVPLIAPMAAFWWGYYLSQMKSEEVGPCPRPQEVEDEWLKRAPRV